MEMSDLTVMAWFDILRRGISTAFMLWLALRFGLSLRAARVPIIEQIARLSEPSLSPKHQSYVRCLTWVWCVYFLIVALVMLIGIISFPWGGVIVALSSIVLFVLEYKIRFYIFPKQSFPSLLTQVKHTYRVWSGSSSVKSDTGCVR